MIATICLKVTLFTPHILSFCMHAPEVTSLQSGPWVPSVWPWDPVTRGTLLLALQLPAASATHSKGEALWVAL